MSFIYPRVVAITRPATLSPSQVGAIDYQVLDADQETIVAIGLPASIQQDRTGMRLTANLPGDILRGMCWSIFIRPITKGVLKDNDIITDDEGIRYQVTAAYWNSLGVNAKCERLEN